MSDDRDLPEYTDEEMRRLTALPRELALENDTEERVVRALRAEGILRPRSRTLALRAAAAIALFVSGGIAGAWYAERGSLEAQIARSDLSSEDRILLLQRVGSAYVSASEAYVASTAATDSAAVEVARRVLIGAARGVARADLENQLSPRLIAALESPDGGGPEAAPAVIWY
jgi:hypothetical protein